MKTAIVIPARYGSTRLPGKPLLRSTGKYLIQHVYELACRAKAASQVIVATDDTRILSAVESFGGTAVMTRKDHQSGTDRIAEVAAGLDADAIVNLQGDEPQFEPAALDQLADLLKDDPKADVATLATPIRDRAIYLSPNCVKVVCDDAGRALYFSRSPIPMVRDGAPDFAADPPQFLLHLGVYAYRRDTLLRLATTPPHPLERTEKLEQLRVLGMGGVIRVGVVPHAHHGVDTPADYDAFVDGVRGIVGRAA
ncbi:3-deoxy-manno-octulosonate cytidylyltransferase [Fimbriiglobus ruber]|uniref:3-deoxy-manno-octulosonate cytidylyltransferase n=1 Tax=Fimbriiglobus ruber TaxID=1908690 RepID=A0A225D0V2_9BACT|nr:3-deoxy-manno-octulosonate cytidylyltransferase [Fimbriiglobus ruber]OWK34563.1 3-deoxy-manno-octulosonate cytidylyltransferase [Fimbriiglobus ruber]